MWSGIALAVGGMMAFVLMVGLIHGLEAYERNHEAKLTPMEKELQQERETPKEGLGKVIPTKGVRLSLLLTGTDGVRWMNI